MSQGGYYSPTSWADPKRAVALRMVAWVIDLVLYCAFALATFFPLAESANTSDFRELTPEPTFGGLDNSFCAQLRESRAFSECVTLGDTSYFTTGGRTIAHSLVALLWFLAVHVVLQGITGGSLGKLASGVRVVQADGSPPGIGRALVRSLFWVVDGIPCCAPLVGLITMLATSRKQRVGDLVAKTFVVRSDQRGRPVAPEGGPPQGLGGPPGSSWDPAASGYPPSGGYPPPPSPGFPPAPGQGYPPPSWPPR